MVRTPLQYRCSTVELLGEQDAHELVRKGHGRKSQYQIRPLANLFRHTVGTAHHEHHLAYTLVAPGPKATGELHASELGSAFVQDNHLLPRLQSGHYPLTFNPLLIEWLPFSSLWKHRLLGGETPRKPSQIMRHHVGDRAPFASSNK